MKYKAILFDMDGTVLDTAADMADAVNATLARWQRPAMSTQSIVDATGNGARVLVAKCLPLGEADPDFEAIYTDYRTYYAAHSLIKTAPYPGTAEMLQRLAAAGVKVAIVSNKPNEAVQTLAEKLFPGIPAFGEKPGIPHKPAPEPVLHALRELGEEVSRALYVGDSEVDIETAKNCRMDFVGVGWGFRGREKLLAVDPRALVADSWEDFLQIIR